MQWTRHSLPAALEQLRPDGLRSVVRRTFVDPLPEHAWYGTIHNLANKLFRCLAALHQLVVRQGGSCSPLRCHPMLWVMLVCRPNDAILQILKMGTPNGSTSWQQYGLSACLLPLRQLPDPSLHHHVRMCENSPPQKTPCYCPSRLTTTPFADQEALARPRACVLPAHGWTAVQCGAGVCMRWHAHTSQTARARGHPHATGVRGSALRETTRQGARARAVCVRGREVTRMQAGKCVARSRATGAQVISNTARRHLSRDDPVLK